MTKRYTLGDKLFDDRPGWPSLFRILDRGSSTLAYALPDVVAGISNSCIIYGGHFYGGTYNGGIFHNGVFHGGEFNGGYFHGGMYYGGVFNDGRFTLGEYYAGTFCFGYHGGNFFGGYHTHNNPYPASKIFEADILLGFEYYD